MSSSGVYPAVTIPATSAYTPVVTINTGGVGKITITGIVGGTGPLTGLELIFRSAIGGNSAVALQDSDFSTATDTLLRSLGLSAPTNIATGSSFQFTVDLLGAVGQVVFSAKSAAGATVQVDVLTTN